MKIVAILIAVWSAVGCKQPRFDTQEAVSVTIKTPQKRFRADGFVSFSNEAIRLDLYRLGQSFLRAKLSENSVCIEGKGCVDYPTFHRYVLGVGYEAPIFYAMLRKQPIAQCPLERLRSGFTQKCATRSASVVQYRVLNNRRTFRDTIKQIFIKVESL